MHSAMYVYEKVRHLDVWHIKRATEQDGWTLPNNVGVIIGLSRSKLQKKHNCGHKNITLLDKTEKQSCHNHAYTYPHYKTNEKLKR